ncbi:MAG: SanA/YdcF family protein [Bacillota bacterium]
MLKKIERTAAVSDRIKGSENEVYCQEYIVGAINVKAISKLIALILIFILIISLTINLYVLKYRNYATHENQIDSNDKVAIVLGAFVTSDGRLCDMLTDRVDTAVDLYKYGKVKKILMTGDHGREAYDEVNSMRKYAEARGVPTEDIFMDHAGFSTYDSMYRARDVFMVDAAVIITQNFHLPRAIYIARKLGIDAVGVSADRHVYAGAEIYDYREVLARIKAFIQVMANDSPKFLGPAIPVSGDGRATHDFK